MKKQFKIQKPLLLYIIRIENIKNFNIPFALVLILLIHNLSANKLIAAGETISNADEIPPEINCPPPINVTCIFSIPAYYTNCEDFINAGGSIFDNNELNYNSFSWVNDISDGNKDPETIIRSYRIEDIAGNASTCEQLIIIDDFTVTTWSYLEGAAIDPAGEQKFSVPMRTDLNDLQLLPGPTYQHSFTGTVYAPASLSYHNSPWNYYGNESEFFDSYGNPEYGSAGYSPTVVDWILVSLRSTPDGENLSRKAALLHSNGRVEFVNGGFSGCNLSWDGTYYIAVEHRNHLIALSFDPVTAIDGTLTYDFRYSQSYIDNTLGTGAYGQKEILPGIYALFAGNGEQILSNCSFTDINYDDRTFWESENSKAGRYNHGDYNLNGDCNYNDRITYEYNNCKFSTIPKN